MATSLTSTPWHAIFSFLIPTIGNIVQMHFPNSSPLDEHPANIWIFIICSLFYCFAFGYHIKCQAYPPTDTTSLNRCVKVAFISGSFAYTALISVLVSPCLQPLAFLVCLMLQLLYFNSKKISGMGENLASSLHELGRKTKRRASNLYEQWKRTDSGNVLAISPLPV